MKSIKEKAEEYGYVNWQSDDYHEGASEDLDSFAIKYAQDKPYPVTVCQAVKVGANWQKQQMMAKAFDIKVKVDAGGYPYIPQMELYDYDKDVPLAKEGDKYKVILIKE